MRKSKKAGSNADIMAKANDERSAVAELAAAEAKQAAELANVAANKAAELAQAATVVSVNIQYIQEDIREIKQAVKDMTTHYVSKEEFSPVKTLVYGMVSLILVAVVGGLIALVVTP